MKSCAELAAEIKHGLMFHQHDFKFETGKDYLTETIRRIQLDAYRAGGLAAAKCIAPSQIMTMAEYQDRTYYSAAILTHFNNPKLEILE